MSVVNDVTKDDVLSENFLVGVAAAEQVVTWNYLWQCHHGQGQTPLRLLLLLVLKVAI